MTAGTPHWNGAGCRRRPPTPSRGVPTTTGAHQHGPPVPNAPPRPKTATARHRNTLAPAPAPTTAVDALPDPPVPWHRRCADGPRPVLGGAVPWTFAAAGQARRTAARYARHSTAPAPHLRGRQRRQPRTCSTYARQVLRVVAEADSGISGMCCLPVKRPAGPRCGAAAGHRPRGRPRRAVRGPMRGCPTDLGSHASSRAARGSTARARAPAAVRGSRVGPRGCRRPSAERPPGPADRAAVTRLLAGPCRCGGLGRRSICRPGFFRIRRRRWGVFRK